MVKVSKELVSRGKPMPGKPNMISPEPMPAKVKPSMDKSLFKTDEDCMEPKANPAKVKGTMVTKSVFSSKGNSIWPQ